MHCGYEFLGTALEMTNNDVNYRPVLSSDRVPHNCLTVI
jgi:hypothetical protein